MMKESCKMLLMAERSTVIWVFGLMTTRWKIGISQSDKRICWRNREA